MSNLVVQTILTQLIINILFYVQDTHTQDLNLVAKLRFRYEIRVRPSVLVQANASGCYGLGLDPFQFCERRQYFTVFGAEVMVQDLKQQTPSYTITHTQVLINIHRLTRKKRCVHLLILVNFFATLNCCLGLVDPRSMPHGRDTEACTQSMMHAEWIRREIGSNKEVGQQWPTRTQALGGERDKKSYPAVLPRFFFFERSNRWCRPPSRQLALNIVDYIYCVSPLQIIRYFYYTKKIKLCIQKGNFTCNYIKTE